MWNIQSFSWVWTEIVTPFNEKWEIDFEALDVLIDMQLSFQVKWIYFLWITWESSTLSKTEKTQLIERWIQKIWGKCLVMVWISTNSTSKAINLINEFNNISWIDAFSVIVPYYNNPTQEWLYRHFEAISKQTSKRIFINNNPLRAWINFKANTLLRLSRTCYNIIWIIDLNRDLEQIKQIIDNKKDDFVVFTWNDDLAYEVIKLWWNWVISIVSNIFPATMIKIVNWSLKRDFDSIMNLNNELKKFFLEDFYTTNPLPIKFILSTIWLIKEIYRLPLFELDLEKKEIRLDTLRNYNEFN